MSTINPGQLSVTANKNGGVDLLYKSSSGHSKYGSSLNNLSGNLSTLDSMISSGYKGQAYTPDQVALIRSIANGGQSSSNPIITQATKAAADAYYPTETSHLDQATGVITDQGKVTGVSSGKQIIDSNSKTAEPQLDANGQNPNDPSNQYNTLTGEANPNYNPTAQKPVQGQPAPQEQPQPLFSGANLQQGATGPQVAQLQAALGISADGKFGPQTLAAVKAFQLSHGLTPDGVVGPKTMQALNGTQSSPLASVGAGISSGKTNATTGTTDTPISTGNPTIDALFAQLKNASPQTTFSEVYKQALKDSGVQDMKNSYNAQVKAQSDLENKKNDEIQDINNNPWYSEGVRVQKLQQLDAKYEGKETILQNQIKLLSTNIDNARQDAQYITGQTMDQANKTSELNETIISKAIDVAEQQQEAEQKLQTKDTQVVEAGGRQKLIDTQTGKVIADLGASSSALSRSSSGAGGSSGDPTVEAWVNAVLSGNSTMAQVPANLRNAVAVSLNAPADNSYTVNPGDTYHDLAAKNGTTVEALRAANPGVNENNLKVGQKINLAGSTAVPYSPLAGSRLALEATRITKPLTELPQYQLTANGLPYLQRIDAAIQNPGSVSDQDLLDSLTKLNTAGNAITDAQVRIITDGRSYLDTINTYLNKFQNGGVLSPSQRTQIQKIAQTIYSNYKAGYQPVYDQAVSQLKAAGIPEAFWTIPDLNKLNGQTGSTKASDPLGLGI